MCFLVLMYRTNSMIFNDPVFYSSMYMYVDRYVA